MNPIILFTIFMCIIFGVIDAIKKMKAARRYGIGVKESNNIFTYFFCDRYR